MCAQLFTCFAGYLTKEGGKSKTWKKRWFTLVNGCLYYFEKEAAKTPKGIVPLENLKVEALPSFTAKKNCFELTSNDAGGTVKGNRPVACACWLRGALSALCCAVPVLCFLLTRPQSLCDVIFSYRCKNQQQRPVCNQLRRFRTLIVARPHSKEARHHALSRRCTASSCSCADVRCVL